MVFLHNFGLFLSISCVYCLLYTRYSLVLIFNIYNIERLLCSAFKNYFSSPNTILCVPKFSLIFVIYNKLFVLIYYIFLPLNKNRSDKILPLLVFQLIIYVYRMNFVRFFVKNINRCRNNIQTCRNPCRLIRKANCRESVCTDKAKAYDSSCYHLHNT